LLTDALELQDPVGVGGAADAVWIQAAEQVRPEIQHAVSVIDVLMFR